MVALKIAAVFAIVFLSAGVVFLFTAPEYVRDTQRVAELNQIQKALEFYYADKKMYPPFTAYTTSEPCGYNWCKLETTLGLYMKQLPRDPIGPSNEFAYLYDSSPANGYQSYGLAARMEEPSDDQRVSPNGYYEIGTRSLYCTRKYANSPNQEDTNWWPRPEKPATVCWGGN